MDAQPFLKHGQIKLMATQLRFPIEQQRHFPAVLGLERRIGIYIDGTQFVPGSRYQRDDFCRHLLTQQASRPREECQRSTHP